jgi:hypothetical protein
MKTLMIGLGAVLLVWGGGTSVFALLVAAPRLRAVETQAHESFLRMVATNGRITEASAHGEGDRRFVAWHVTYQFGPIAGAMRRGFDRVEVPAADNVRFKAGEGVRIWYDPQQPRQAMIDREHEWRRKYWDQHPTGEPHAAWLFGEGLALALIGAALIARARRGPTRAA